MISVKKLKPEKVISFMSLTLFALLLAEAYLNHKDDIDASVTRLKSVLNDNKEEGAVTENAE